MDLKNVNLNNENVVDNNLNLKEFSFLEIVKNKLKNIVQSFFNKKDALSAHKTSFFMFFTSLFGIE